MSRPICYECDAKQRGKSTFEAHHVAGRANDPTTIDVPVNDHRAELSVDQYEWPRGRLQNPDAARCLRCRDASAASSQRHTYFMERLLGWIPPQLETLDAFLASNTARSGG